MRKRNQKSPAGSVLSHGGRKTSKPGEVQSGPRREEGTALHKRSAEAWAAASRFAWPRALTALGAEPPQLNNHAAGDIFIAFIPQQWAKGAVRASDRSDSEARQHTVGHRPRCHEPKAMLPRAPTCPTAEALHLAVPRVTAANGFCRHRR
ncbi:hypothetical protein Fuma_04162 [Fuerstiella marisgermanici]|uniref:Uncharacterized protein n=1 Tax=Fuerstiella marisgermanici TaxID=1891926 RepID=A0A1P8WKF4_9PLAN|nr:hypothetical protein Fuma_04162 [Fuerstiella marisgermanici]